MPCQRFDRLYRCHYDQKVKEKVQKVIFGSMWIRTGDNQSFHGRSLSPLSHSGHLRYLQCYRVLNYTKNRLIFGWPSRPRKDIKGHNFDLRLCLRPPCILWKQWDADVLRCKGVMALKVFHREVKAE